MAKVISRVKGGLGNQLFCYAAARRLALVNHAELVIDDVSGFARDFDYRRCYQLDHFNVSSRKATSAERLEPFSRARHYLKRRFNSRLQFENRTYIQQDEADFDVRLLDFIPCGTVYLEGYWQSEGYFKDVESIIRQDLRIKPPMDAANLDMAAQIRSSPAIAVHVRFFDTPAMEGIHNASLDFYSRAVMQMESIAPDAHYFVFSDHPAAARKRIPLPDARVTLVGHNEGDSGACADLWLMSQCRHFIIANSTFSWWGAWLSEHSEKNVIAPGFEMRSGKTSWGFEGLLPPEWIRL